MKLKNRHSYWRYYRLFFRELGGRLLLFISILCACAPLLILPLSGLTVAFHFFVGLLLSFLIILIPSYFVAALMLRSIETMKLKNGIRFQQIWFLKYYNPYSAQIDRQTYLRELLQYRGYWGSIVYEE